MYHDKTMYGQTDRRTDQSWLQRTVSRATIADTPIVSDVSVSIERITKVVYERAFSLYEGAFELQWEIGFFPIQYKARTHPDFTG